MAGSGTGSAELPDIGQLFYNGVTFSSLYTSQVSGECVQDASNRTTKYMAYTITVDGLVTLNDDVGDKTVDREWMFLRRQLTADAGVLVYTGKGFGQPFIVNQPGGTLFDVNWGPKPKLLEFVPLGASRSAKIKWTVTTYIPEFAAPVRVGTQVLQFNQESSVGYNEDGYSTLSISGTLEIPLTRPTQGTLTLTRTVDDFRQVWMSKISNSFDLTRFRVTAREFPTSRDGRTMEWKFGLEELPPMGPPLGILTAHGSMTCKPMKQINGIIGVRWLTTLKATYTIPKGQPRRMAYVMFMSLWIYRMRQALNGVVQGTNVPVAPTPFQASAPWISTILSWVGVGPGAPPPVIPAPVQNIGPPIGPGPNPVPTVGPPNPANGGGRGTQAMPINFSFEEGIYLDSKTVSFEASWIVTTTLSNLLAATGIWQSSGVEAQGPVACGRYATSIKNITGPVSWLPNPVDPASLAIVDFGSS